MMAAGSFRFAAMAMGRREDRQTPMWLAGPELACETGAHRRVRLRGRDNIRKRYLAHVAALNLGLVMRTLFGHGTPAAGGRRRARDTHRGAVDRPREDHGLWRAPRWHAPPAPDHASPRRPTGREPRS